LKTRLSIAVRWFSLLLASGFLAKSYGQAALAPKTNPTVTNLLQLVELVNADERLVRDVQLEATVCAAGDAATGVVILRDATAAELFEFSGRVPELSAGDVVRINRKNCLLRRRELGVQISTRPILDSDGIHGRRTTVGGLGLKKGRHPLSFEWFSRLNAPVMEIRWQVPGSELVEMPATNLFHFVKDEDAEQKVVRPGLLAECFEGDWERVPNFDLIEPARTVVVTNFDASVGTRGEFYGIRFRGVFDAPVDGVYRFSLRSADGGLLFIEDESVALAKVGMDAAPAAMPAVIGEAMPRSTQQQWMVVEGQVRAVRSTGRGLEINLYSGRNALLVRIADASGLAISNLLGSQIRVAGVGCGLINMQGAAMLGQLFAASAREVELIHPANIENPNLSVLTTAGEVQTLMLDDAGRHLPVHLRGVVTSKGKPVDAWISVQDETRGIFVSYHSVSNGFPMCGDFCEITGHSDAGDFAPVVVAEQMIRLGSAELPEPTRPTWDELNNGSMDVQRVEVMGLVTDVHSNILSMLLPSGHMEVQVEGPSPTGLKSLTRAVVRIRGVLFAMWNATREVRAGSILIRNAGISVEIPAPKDPFDAVLKTPRELLLFDAQATAFRRVKVRGQIVYADSTQSFVQDDGKGLRLLLADHDNVQPGDMVEAVGYPDISKAAMQLREVTLRKTGWHALPPARTLTASMSELDGLDSTRVSVEGELLGWHFEQGKPVLEMQSDRHLYLARLAKFDAFPLSVGSRLALEGVYVTQGKTQAGGDAFELLLNSPKDITILSQPSWWTLERLLILVGFLAAVLLASAIWITQLRRLVEQRTEQLRRETQEREIVERERALEVERSRIARDLHDDLGSSLTEIAVLASKGQRASASPPGATTLFHTITSKARELVAALDIIVWAVDPKDNSLQSVADYLCDFIDEYLSPSGIACRFDVPVTLPSIVLEGRARHDLFLAVKETLNNVVRHAGATEVKFRLAVVNGWLDIVIADNGKGFDMTSSQTGKGLKSLPLRMSRMGGKYEVTSTGENGTVIKIEMPLPMPANGEASRPEIR
jgi:signal transduction histidine kinase